MHGFGSVTNSGSAEAQVFDEAHELLTFFGGAAGSSCEVLVAHVTDGGAVLANGHVRLEVNSGIACAQPKKPASPKALLSCDRAGRVVY